MADIYPRLAEILVAAGCHRLRAGKGSHEIWFSPTSSTKFSVPRTTKSRHTANEVLKQAGLPKAF
jgi:hypothetical protein